ncbi:MAG: 5-oxoprolinase subunit PxpA [Phycisphaerales bacterium]|nr:5-oxoprolinase subunit PxpA [Phycisphaerales bacterium]
MSAPEVPFLNCDLGECNVGEGSPTPDHLLMPWIAAANIACGGHAGDPASMRRVTTLALSHSVRLGAHPSYPDRANFGRTVMAISAADLEASLSSQISALRDIARDLRADLSHVKPHGALYHACEDPALAALIARVVEKTCPHAALVGRCGSRAVDTWRRLSRPVWTEAFADRLYLDDGSLAPRSTPGAVISDQGRAASQALRIAQGLGAPTASGGTIPLRPTTICIHSDSPGAALTAQRVGAALRSLIQ